MNENQLSGTSIKKQQSRIIAPIALFCCLLWGSAFPAIKIGYRFFAIESGSPESQILYAGLRFTLSGILIMVFCFAERKKLLPGWKNVKYIIILALFQTVLQYSFFYIGLSHTSGVKSSIFSSLNVFMTLCLSALYFHEKINQKKIIGCITGFTGVMLVALSQNGSWDSGFRFSGEGFLLLAALFSSIATICLKRFSENMDPVLLCGYQFLCGGITMLVIGILCGGKAACISPSGIPTLLYLGFVSAAAFSLWSMLLQKNPVSKVTVFSFSIPVFGVLLSSLFLGEFGQAMHLEYVIALILVSLGIYLVNQ